MRPYAIFLPAFWTGRTGREIRSCGPLAQLVAAYLLTAPSSTMIGLYYLPLVTLAHETNTTPEEAKQILAVFEALDFAHYDEPQETVWVTNMAFYQIAEALEPRDNRWLAVLRELLAYSRSPFFPRFVRLYREPFHLDDGLELDADGNLAGPPKVPLAGKGRRGKGPGKPLPSPSQAPHALTSEDEQAPPEPRAGARAGAGTRAGTRAAAAGAPPAAAARRIPDFLEQVLVRLGVPPGDRLGLFNDLGRHGLQAALVKLVNIDKLRNPCGMLLSRSQELAQEGMAMLNQELRRELEPEPRALEDSRLADLPEELREDLEIQTAWARWIHWERQPGADQARATERGMRRSLLDLLIQRHPDPEQLRTRINAALQSFQGIGALPPQTQKLMADSQVFGLIQEVPHG